MKAITVAVTDGMPLFRRGAAEALEEEPDVEVISRAGNAQQALHEIRRLTPDVAVLEVGAADFDEKDVLRALAREGIATQIILVSDLENSAGILDGMASGVSGYLSKHASEEEIRRAVRTVAAGDTIIPSSLRTALQQELAGTANAEQISLSSREQETLTLLANGGSSATIARELHVSEASVRTYLQRAYNKLDVSKQTSAVAEALRRGLIE